MSIASQLQALEGNIEDAYDMVAQRGGTMPQRKNMENLDDAIATIPSATTPGDGTLTIQKNGTTVATFTANQSTNTTANISVQENSTMFYGKADTLPGEAGLVIYNNATRTTQTTWQQFADALQAGPVSITFDGDVLDHPYPIAVIYSEVYGGSISFTVESAGASYIYIWDDTDTEPGAPTIRRYQPLLTAGSNISISSNTISATDTTYSDFTGATSSVAGANGLVPAPAAGDQNKVLTGAGTWSNVTGSNMDFSSAAGTAVVKTITDNLGRTGIYFADGTLITTRKVQYVGHIDTAWGTLYEGHTNDYYKFAPTGGDDFIAEPNVQVTLFNTSTSGSCWLGAWEKNVQIVSGGWAIPAGALCFLRASAFQVNVTLDLHIQAIGRWK